MKRVLLVLLVLFAFNSNAQIITSPDTAVCGSYVDTLQALSSTQSSMFSDDQHDVLLDIGFTFNFYGLPYTQLVVSGNGYVTFDASQASSYSPWAINAAIPNPGNLPENAIMAPWQDLNTFIGGNIFYGMTGVAPNRVYTVTWCAIPMFSCTSDLHTSQIVLYEGSDKIEIYIQNKPICTGWNSGNGIHGLVDATSTNFDIVDDPVLAAPRNFGLQWTAINEGWEFLPNNPSTSYTINQIAYVPIVAGANTWTDAAGNILGTGPSLPVNISTPTMYYANVTGTCAFGNLSDSVSIIVTACFALDLTSTEASCLGDDATLTVTPDTLLPLWDITLFDMNGSVVIGGVVLNYSGTSFTFVDLFPGTYVVSVSSGINVSQDTLVVTQIPNPVTINSNPSGVSCYNGSDGQVAIWPSGGLAPYTFLIDGNPILNAFPLDSLVENLSGGFYIVSAIDDNNCMMRDTVEITTPSHPLQALATSKVVVCYGEANGFAIGSSAGGTPGYSYEWFEFGNPVSFSANDTAFGLGAGSYFLEVMDANGCDTFASVNVIEPQTALGGSPQIFGVSCKGDASGMLVGDATGSWAPYRYEWFDMSGNLLQISGMVSERDTLFDLLAGDYVLKIFDAQGCEKEYVLNVPEPSVALAIDSMILIDDIACYGDSVGRAMLSVSGGQPNYYYEWDNGETTLVAEELTSGWHSVLLTDDWGCKLVDSVFISENTLIVSDLVVDTTVSCYGFSDGQASISTLGGSSFLYTYYWSTSQTTLNANVDVASGLSYGSYYVTTRDDLGCEVVDTVFISEPEPLSMEAMEVDWVDCYNDATGEGVAVAVGGTAPYSFSWDNGTWTSNQGDTLATLTKGLHTVVVTDLRGCTASDTVEIHNPDSLYIVIDESQTVLPYCVGVNTASLSAVATGGTGSYSYVWNDNPALAQTTTTASALLADNYYNTVDSSYTIIVTDDKGCTASVNTDTLQNFVETMDADTILISQYYNGTTDANEVSCFGYNDGEVSVSVWGGHGPYTYAWAGINPPNFTANTATISNLYAGVYSVTIRDTNDCMINRGVELIQPDMLTFNTSVVIDESCYGACDGEIVVDSIAGGVATYSAQLTDNITAITTAHAIMGNSITAVCSGDYTVALTDINSCPSVVIAGGIDQQLVETLEFTEANIGVVSGEVCYGASTGELAVLNPNINTGYTYSWENTNNPGQSIAITTTVAGLSAGTYVLLADYNNTVGCTATDSFTITSMPMLEITYHTVSDVLCNGGNTGEVMVVPSVDVVNPTYSWSNGSNTSAASNLQAGTYILTMTDINGCDQDFSYTVNEPSAVVVNVSATQIYILNANATGGTPPYSYSWREQSSSNTSLGSQATYTVGSNGIYYVVVTDDNGCEETSEVTTYNEGTTGLDNAPATNIELNIYPNPFKDATTVDFGRVIKEAKITVVDVYGKLIETHKLESQATYVIKRNTKASGVYFMEIEIEGEKSKIQKLIIE
jgi:hypothetical protein